ncbi:type II secretion system F family protein [Actinoplanes sp. L3-i22]|uniref:type II secretion system F family protein n=1 Tax=Actinoplanes sp. L3-i22 TaxID=2836373 RepID=UPI001C747C9D|nr:type II secretion system F family protein [Actinoplanes sp. L3-i22]BCY10926.1 type II secretion system protein [Actinoplanes sp. L3-i22]
MTPLMFALLVAAAVLGIILAITGAVGASPAVARPARWRQRLLRSWTGAGLSDRRRRTRQLSLAAAVAVTVAVWLITAIPVAGIIAGAAVVGVPWLFGAGAAEQRAIAQLEALETWTRQLTAVVRTGLGLNEAILVSTRDAPAAIGDDLRLLEAHLRGGVPIPTALDRLAGRLADATADEVIVALRLHATDRGQSLADILDMASANVADDITDRREVWANRADPRLTSKVMTGLGIAAFSLLVINPPYARPYSSLIGQTVMVGSTLAFLGLLLWVRKLSGSKKPPRILDGGDPS